MPIFNFFISKFIWPNDLLNPIKVMVNSDEDTCLASSPAFLHSIADDTDLSVGAVRVFIVNLKWSA